MSTVSKVDYLKRYMSDGSDKKKKRKKIGKSVSPRIFDDDVDIKSLLPENQDVTMDDDLAENAPTVAEFVDERPLHVQQLEQYQDKIRWKSVEETNAEEGEIVSEEEIVKEKNDLEDDGHISSDGELSDTNHSHESGGSDASPSKPKKQLSDERATPPPKNPAQNSLSNISSKTKEGADRQEEQKPRNDSDTDDSMEEGRIPDDSGSEPSPRRRVRHNLESDKSPKKRHDSRSESESSPLREGQSRRVRHDSDSDSRSNPLKRSLHDSDSDGSSSDSDQPAPRRRRQHSDAKPGRSTSPSPSKRAPKARPGSDSDGSTTRRRRLASDSDHSPPRRRRHSSDSDQSPPHRRKPASDSDHSPRRRRPASDSDASPRRRRSVSDSDQSPRRRKRNSDSDNSPPRTSRRHSSDSDSSPPRRRAGKADRSTSRHRNNSSAVSKERRTQRGDSDSDLSPPRPGRNSSPVRRPQLDSRGRRQKTLGGAKAGLSTADDMRREARHMRYKEDRMFRQLDNTVSGKDAETIVRDRSTGRRRDLKQEQMRKNEEQKRKELKDQKYAEWGKGLKQKAKQEQAVQDTMHELSKPLARYKDDKDLDQMMREQDRAGDPMLAFIKKKKKPDKDGKERPTYKGPAPPPNRFNIMPGYRWDGVDRSNGFENQIYQKTAEKKATAAMAYKWSTEDM